MTARVLQSGDPQHFVAATLKFVRHTNWRIHRNNAMAPPGHLAVERCRTVAAPDNRPLKVAFGERKHPHVLVERTAPRHGLQ